MTISNRTGYPLEKSHEKRIKDQSPEDMEQFRNILFELSARLISVFPAKLDTEISEGLKRIGEFWGFDKIVLAEMTGEGKELAGIHLYSAPGLPYSRPVAPLGSTPWFRERLFRGEAICLAHLPDDVPENETADREYCLQEGIKSSLILPLVFDESIRGALSVFSLTSEYVWTEELIKELHLVGEIMASALERKKIIASVREHIGFEQLLSDISGTYIKLPIDEIEQHVKEDLGHLAELLGAGRCVLYLAGEDSQSFRYELPYVWWPAEDNKFFQADNDFWRVMDHEKGGEGDFFENLSYIFNKWSRGETFQFSSLEELPKEAEKVRQFYARFGVKSFLSIPILVGGSTAGALVIATTREHRTWPEDLVPRIRLFGEVFINALSRKRAEESLQNALSEIKSLKERYETDYRYLKEEINLEHDFRGIVGKSEIVRQVLVKIKQVAPTSAIVLLLGETGTGKGLMARAIHDASTRKDRPLVQVNCAALTPSLIESELFGYEKGAFTGAQARRIGRFEVAHGTTLFLDEIGELPLELQAKLLRVLQDGEFERVGGSTTVRTDVRIIAATNKDVAKEVEAGRFRQDLWYRLNIFPIHVPPLRERIEDIPLFVNFFVDKYAKWIGKKFDIIPQKTIKDLQSYSWPGNIRELENAIERAVITSPEGELRVELLSHVHGAGPQSPASETLDEIDRAHMLKILEDCYWVIEGPRGAARRLGLTPSTLRYQSRRLGIKRPK